MTDRKPVGGKGTNQHQVKGATRTTALPPPATTRKLKEQADLAAGTAFRRTTEPTVDDLDRSYLALTKAVAALAPHLDALTLVGAQAIYVHAPEMSDFGVAATSDADVVVDVDLLGDSPLLVDALQGGGFRRASRDRPGIWLTEVDAYPVTVDLIVPETFAGAGSRGARLGVHGKDAATRSAGTELCLRDRKRRSIPIPDGEVPLTMWVAGPSALLCAKAFKLHDRFADTARQDRVRAKDASDVWRLMSVTAPGAIASTWAQLEQDPTIRAVAVLGRKRLIDLFGEGGAGAALADQALRAERAYVASTVTDWIAEFWHHTAES